jgi:hypothetical protein
MARDRWPSATYASSILVTRSTTSGLVRAAFRPASTFSVLRAMYWPLLPRFTLDPNIQGSRDLAVTFAGRVLIDE